MPFQPLLIEINPRERPIAVSSAADLPRSRVIQSTEDVQKRRFARTRWPKQDHQLAGEQIEIDARQGVDLDLTIAVGLGEPASSEYDIGHVLSRCGAIITPLSKCERRRGS